MMGRSSKNSKQNWNVVKYFTSVEVQAIMMQHLLLTANMTRAGCGLWRICGGLPIAFKGCLSSCMDKPVKTGCCKVSISEAHETTSLWFLRHSKIRCIFLPFKFSLNGDKS